MFDYLNSKARSYIAINHTNKTFCTPRSESMLSNIHTKAGLKNVDICCKFRITKEEQSVITVDLLNKGYTKLDITNIDQFLSN